MRLPVRPFPRPGRETGRQTATRGERQIGPKKGGKKPSPDNVKSLYNILRGVRSGRLLGPKKWGGGFKDERTIGKKEQWGGET